MLDPATFLLTNNRFAPWHTERYLVSLQWASKYLTSESKALELGGPGPFTNMLRQCTPARVLSGHIPDLRYRFPLDDGLFDLVLCLEVLEHLCDRSDGRLDIFTGSGIKNALAESRRVLREGGHLLISTPNVCCYNSIWNLLRGEHPFSYAPHYRELPLRDLLGYVTEAGFSVVRQQILSVWKDRNVPVDIKGKIDKLAAELDLEVDRQDCIFILARK